MRREILTHFAMMVFPHELFPMFSMFNEVGMILDGYDEMSPEIRKFVPDDLTGPNEVQNSVNSLLYRWSKVFPIPPDVFLNKILKSHGYRKDNARYLRNSRNLRLCSHLIPSSTLFTKHPRRDRPPTDAQIDDYEYDLLQAVRHSDKESLRHQISLGKR